MSSYVLFTDLSCDIEPELLKEWDVEFCSLKHYFTDEPEKEYTNLTYPVKQFYDEMRNGRVSKTSAIDIGTFVEEFRKILDTGKDILYLAFSSGLSSTYNNSVVAAGQLAPLYPDRKILISDTRSASAGMGLLVYLTAMKKREGATMEEAFAYAEEQKFHLCHWFTVSDLVYLKRGGRVSAAAAFFGGVLGIKPVLHMDDPGHLIPMMKVKGRKNSILKMADKYGELSIDPAGGTVFISHGDCIEDAQMLAGILAERYGVKVQLITYVGSVIGAHSGPGTLALFFLGTQR
ncbi:MAG: DegV family protein [Clostridia bacterium]|nr:DegV family protein [Clostridia bacterium]